MQDLLEQGKTHLDRDEWDAAINSLSEFLNTDFGHADASFMLGCAFLARGKTGLGAILTRHAIKAKGGNFPEGLRNLGTAFRMEERRKEAEDIWNLALEQETVPKARAVLLACLATLFINEDCPQKAVDLLNQALEIDPDNPVFLYNRGLAYLELGNWAEGWRGYEAGFRSSDRRSRHYGTLPLWRGEPGKRVIVWGEQGIGDEILFASCLPDLIKISEKVILDCHPRLTDLFERSFPGIEVHGTRKTMSFINWFDQSGADCHVCVSSLPLYFRQKDADFPGKPFLVAQDSPEIKLSGKPRIGISWSGGTKKTRMDLRTIPLTKWLPVLQSVDADFFSLQYTPDAAREVCSLEDTTGIHVRHFPGWVEAKDYDKTASFVKSLDLVITVPTAIYHLANAVGTETWTLIPSRPGWTFAAGAECWYRDTAKLYRQTESDWTAVLEKVAEDLRARYGV